MKKHIVSFLFAFLFIFSTVGSVGAANANIPDFSDQDIAVVREAYSDKYNGEALLTMVLEGKITDDPFTDIQIEHQTSENIEVTTVTINELVERQVDEQRNIVSESYIKTSVSSVTAWELSNSGPYASGGSGFTFTVKINYSVIVSNDVNYYKVTKSSTLLSNYYGRIEFKQLDVLCGASGDAYTSSLSRVGYRSESSTWNRYYPNIVSGTTYGTNTGFLYYYNSEVYPCNMGANATVYFTLSNQTTWKSFFVSVTLVNN